MTSFINIGHTLTTWFVFCAVVLFVSFVSHGECQTTPPPTTTPCSEYKSCDTCVPHTQCLWCFSDNNCTEYPVSWLIPPASVCQLSQARWGLCWMNFESLIITVGILGGAIIISIIACCCYCCCCFKKRRSGPDRDEERLTMRREENKQCAEERKLERKERQDEIRRKYGLVGDKDHPYSKFENE